MPVETSSSAAVRTSLSGAFFAKGFQLFQPMAGGGAFLVAATAATGRANRARASRVLRMGSGLLCNATYRAFCNGLHDTVLAEPAQAGAAHRLTYFAAVRV